MFPYPHMSKGIFQLHICISLLETANTPARFSTLLCWVSYKHILNYCFCTQLSLNLRPLSIVSKYLSNILRSDIVRIYPPFQQFRNLSSPIFCVLPGIRNPVSEQTLHVEHGVCPLCCHFRFRVGLSTRMTQDYDILFTWHLIQTGSWLSFPALAFQAWFY